jgi:hypothetical protein
MIGALSCKMKEDKNYFLKRFSLSGLNTALWKSYDAIIMLTNISSQIVLLGYGMACPLRWCGHLQ